MFAFIFVLFIFGSAIAQDSQDPQPCQSTDIPCLNEWTNRFLSQVRDGISVLGIPSVDPLHLPDLKLNLRKLGVTFNLKNVTITGLSKLKVTYFKLHKHHKSVVLKSGVQNANVEATVEIKYNSKNPVYSRIFSVISDVNGTSQYNYSIVTDSLHNRHFDVGPETVKCDVAIKKETSCFIYASIPGLDLARVKRIENEYHAVILEFIFQQGYSAVINYLRVTAAVMPVGGIFKDV